jgi:hypothetical protein
MRRLFVASTFILGLLFVAPQGAADDDETEKVPYPKIGSEVPGPFHVLNITGQRTNRYHSLVCRYGLQPVAVVFVRPEGGDWLKNLDEGQPLATLLQKIDEVVMTNPDAMLGAFAVYNVGKDDELALRNKLETLADALGVKQMVQTLADELRQKGMEAWKVKAADDSEPEVAVVVYARHKVVGLWTFSKDKPLTEKDATTIAAAFDKLVPNSLRPRQKPLLKLKAKEAEKDKDKERIATPPKEKDEPKEKDAKEK